MTISKHTVVWAVLAGLLVTSAARGQNEVAVDAANKKGKALYDQGYYAKAILAYQNAIALATKVYGPDLP